MSAPSTSQYNTPSRSRGRAWALPVPTGLYCPHGNQVRPASAVRTRFGVGPVPGDPIDVGRLRVEELPRRPAVATDAGRGPVHERGDEALAAGGQDGTTGRLGPALRLGVADPAEGLGPVVGAVEAAVA